MKIRLDISELERQSQLAGEPIQVFTGPRLFQAALEDMGPRVVWLEPNAISNGSGVIVKMMYTKTMRLVLK